MGSSFSAPREAAQSTSQALASRVHSGGDLSGAARYASTSPLQRERELGALPPLGDWGSSTEARACTAALDAALAALPVPTRSHGLDLQHYEAMPGVPSSAHVRTRCAFGDAPAEVDPKEARRSGRPRTPLGVVAAFDALWHAPDEWSEQDTSSEPSALVLQHSFASEKAGAGSVEVVLRTTFFGAIPSALHAKYIRAAYDRIPLVFTPEDKQPDFDAAPCAAISVDGEWLTPYAFGVSPAREALKGAHEAQHLHGLRACIQQRWAGGFTMLRRRAAPLLSAEGQLAAAKLAALLMLRRTGSEPTLQLCAIRELQAKLLRSLSRTQEAEAMEAGIKADQVKIAAAAVSAQHDSRRENSAKGIWSACDGS